MNVVPFKFETKSIRTIANEQGEPWFVLRDVLEAMGTSTPTAVAISSVEQGLGEGFNVVIPLETAGGMQQTILVSEAAVTYLLSRSNTEQGRKLNRFIHVEVLPALRRTGQYQLTEPATPAPTMLMTPAAIAASTIREVMSIAAEFGVPTDHALSQAAQAADLQAGTQLWTTVLSQAKCMVNLSAEDRRLEPKDLGAVFGLSGSEMNQWLADRGLQVKVRGQWTPTKTGEELAVLHKWNTAYKSGYNLMWSLSKITELWQSRAR